MNNLILTLLLLASISGFSQQKENPEMGKNKDKYVHYINKYGGYVKTNHTDIHYLQWGKNNQKTFLWLHGSFSNAFEIEPFVQDIAKLGYRIIAIDYYGHGQTKIYGKNFSTNDLLQDINTLLDSLDISTCIVGGFSRGAYLATMFYNKYPQKVEALILEDGGINPFLEHYKILSPDALKTKFEQENENHPKALFEEYSTEKEAYDALKPYGQINKKQRYKNFSFLRFDNEKYVIYKDIDKLYGMDTYENISLLMQGNLATNLFANELMLFPFYNTIANSTIPTLLLEASSKDDPFPNTYYYSNLVSINNNIVHKTFSESDHTIHYDEPKKFKKTITQFLKNNDNQRSTRDR